MRKVPARTITGAAPSTSSRVLRSHTRQAEQAAAEARPTKATKKRRPRADPWAKKRKPNSNPNPRNPPPPHFTCRICIEERPTDQFVKWVPPKRGRWEPTDVPPTCVAHLARVRALNAGCLEPGCSEPWSDDFILRFMPPGAPLEKFNMEMLEVWKETASPAPLTCLSPTCIAVGLPDIMAAGYPQVTCNECSLRSCAQCRVAWHKDVTCTEYSAKHVDEKMSEEEKDTLKYMQQLDGKRCPNCQLVIEKDGGCDSMFCVGCHRYFNWASAASALTGAKRAEVPYIRELPHWHNVSTVACEVDGILGLHGTADDVAAAS